MFLSFVLNTLSFCLNTSYLRTYECYCDKHYDHASLVEASCGATHPEIICRPRLIHIFIPENIKKQFKDTS